MILTLLWCFLAGILTACLYLYILWKEVVYLPKSSYKISLLSGSLTIRLFLIALCFYWIADHSLIRLISALFGFFVVRLICLTKQKNEIKKMLEGKNA